MDLQTWGVVMIVYAFLMRVIVAYMHGYKQKWKKVQMMFDVICWVIIGLSIFALGWVLWACLVIAGRSDDISLEYWNEYWEGKDKDEHE